MKRTRQSSKREPTISLINIVFLILIFFMVAGTLSPPTSPGLEFVQTAGLECCAGKGVLQIDSAGELKEDGQPVSSLQDYLDALPSGDPTIRIAPDRRLPARELLKIVSRFREITNARIMIITENSAS